MYWKELVSSWICEGECTSKREKSMVALMISLSIDIMNWGETNRRLVISYREFVIKMIAWGKFKFVQTCVGKPKRV